VVGAVLAHLPVDALGGAPQRRARAARSGCPCGRSCESRSRRLGHVHLAFVSAPISSSGGRSTARSRAPRRTQRSGTVSRRRIPVICRRLVSGSRGCWTFIAVRTSMPASSSSSMSASASRGASPARWCGASSSTTISGACARARIEVDSCRLDAAIMHARGGRISSPQQGCVSCDRGSRPGRSPRRRLGLLLTRGREHRVGLATPAQARRRFAGARASPPARRAGRGRAVGRDRGGARPSAPI